MFLCPDTQTHNSGGPWDSSPCDPRGNEREMFTAGPSKNSDLDPFMGVLRPHARDMMGAGTRTKMKGKMDT